MTGRADEMKVAGVTICRLETRAAFAEIDLPRDSSSNRPLEGAINRGAANPCRFTADQLEEIVSAEVTLFAALAKEHRQDTIPLAGALAAGRRQARKIGKRTFQISLRIPLRKFAPDDYSTENDCPQPQVEVAFGFLMVNPPPVTVSTKSTSAPFKYRMLIGSM